MLVAWERAVSSLHAPNLVWQQTGRDRGEEGQLPDGKRYRHGHQPSARRCRYINQGTLNYTTSSGPSLRILPSRPGASMRRHKYLIMQNNPKGATQIGYCSTCKARASRSVWPHAHLGASRAHRSVHVDRQRPLWRPRVPSTTVRPPSRWFTLQDQCILGAAGRGVEAVGHESSSSHLRGGGRVSFSLFFFLDTLTRVSRDGPLGINQ